MASSAARKPGSNGYYSNPNQIFDRSSRQFLSSRAGERASYDLDDDARQQRRGGGFASPPPNPTYLPPLVKADGYPASPNGYGSMTKQQQLAAQIRRPSTAAPQSQPPPDRHGTPTSLYPHHLLRSPTRSKTDAYVAPYSTYQSPSAGRDRSNSTANSYGSSTPSYGSPLASPPSSTASPPPPHPNSPTYSSPQSLPRHHHQPHRSHSHTNSSSYATDVTPNSKLLPQRSSKRNSTGANGVQYPGPGAVGPALAGGIYPVLPKPPSVVGSAQPTSISRKMFQRARPIIDEDEEASNALNTYG